MKTGVVTAAMLLLLPAVARGQTLFESKAGVQVPIPKGFAPISNVSVPTTNAKSADAIEAAFTVKEGDAVVSFVVMNPPIGDTRAFLAELPRKSGPTPDSLARKVVAGMMKAAPGFRGDSKTVPLLYDKTRKAFGIELQSMGPSGADALLLLPDDSPEVCSIVSSSVSSSGTTVRPTSSALQLASSPGRWYSDS